MNDETTKVVKVLEDVSRLAANYMWHLKPNTEGGKLYGRIEREITRLKNQAPAAPFDKVAFHATQRAAFENYIQKENARRRDHKRATWGLGTCQINGVVTHYIDPDTDSAWMGWLMARDPRPGWSDAENSKLGGE